MFVPFDDPLVGEDGEERNKKRAMQLILDEIHGMQREWEKEDGEEWAAASTINSSKVLIVTVSLLVWVLDGRQGLSEGFQGRS